MGAEEDRWGLSMLHRCGLRLTGAENQDIRLLIRMTRRRFTAINESGNPLLSGLCFLAQKYPSIRNTMLALAGTMRSWPASITGSNTSGPAYTAWLPIPTDPHNSLQQPANSVPSSTLLRYQSALADLQHKIATLDQTAQVEEDEVVELLGSVLVLICAGFPSSSGPSAKSADWALHISGIISVIDFLDPRVVDCAGDVPRLAREIAAYLDIGAFSLGRVGWRDRGVRLAWLKWKIAPPDVMAPTEGSDNGFSPTEIITGYPRSLVTIIAALSAVLESGGLPRGYGEEVDLLVRETVIRLYERTCEISDDYPPPVARPYNQEGLTSMKEDLFSKLETILTLWRHPSIPPHFSTQLSLALTTTWEIMRKASLIFLWRGGFQTSVLTPLTSSRASTTLKFIREILVGLHALINMYDEQRITIMNVMTWPVVVAANECGADIGLQKEITALLRGMHLRFSVHHIEHILLLLQELWRRVRVNGPSVGVQGGIHQSGLPLACDENRTSLEAVSQDMRFCLPLY
ncbi:fungal-specific transcription factor domain-containing protein [Aspergillus caelatus]|uniref:Fungal-specific transcription factor domain-containing protein n=1 Tax=Aspergillus caelatus TaxID=61420 RepID=A0A5N6ZNV2_9EURO|nr:fungal-specific transcription factor domain-containing protein [Aspergillus caelatus]KAE8358636.1 fungal-specific transcription factor domain-containing protein [Aspergillus caelatus]